MPYDILIKTYDSDVFITPLVSVNLTPLSFKMCHFENKYIKLCYVTFFPTIVKHFVNSAV